MPQKCYYSHRKKMEVNWDRLDPRLQCVDGLDDIMRFDLQHFCRRMQPPEEPHYRSAHLKNESSCARLYCVVRCHVMLCQAGKCKSALACTSVLELTACLYLAYTSRFVALHMCDSCTCVIMAQHRQGSTRLQYRLFCDNAHHAHCKALHNALA